MSAKIKVLVADDSVTTRRMFANLMATTTDLLLIAEATTGKQAVQLATSMRPDVILMDLVMPDLDGLGATRQIMHVAPTPIIVISATLEQKETGVAFQAIKAGALMVMQKPAGVNDPEHAAQVASMLNSIRAMAGVRVIRHHAFTSFSGLRGTGALRLPDALKPHPPRIIAIASSTGGPAALGEILQRLPADFPIPIVIAQHIAADFVPSLASWLSTVTGLKLAIAEPGEQAMPNIVYLAPGGKHMRITKQRQFEMFEDSHRLYVPSCDTLLESVASVYGAAAVGVVLTGMGNDGARGLRAMFDAGAFTIAQDEASSVIFGMPHEASLMGGVCRVLAPPAIAQELLRLSRVELSNHG